MQGAAKLTKTGVVYLCRFAEGEEPVRRFLDSYQRYPAGIGHELHVVFKGYPNREAADALRALFGTRLVSAINLDDSGYDIGSYFSAATVVANPQILFLNTFSEVLADNWLAHFDRALSTPGVGLAGATGSWQSIRSGYEAAVLRMVRRPAHRFQRYAGSAALADEKNVGQRVVAKSIFGRYFAGLAAPSNTPFAFINLGAIPIRTFAATLL